MKIRYSFSGEYSEYNSLLRKFKLDKLLAYINMESAKLMKNNTRKSDDANIEYGMSYEKYFLFDNKNGMRKEQQVLVSGWNLIDLAYNAIKCTNDYRGVEITQNTELYLLVSATEAVREKKEGEFLDSIQGKSGPDFFLYLWGFAGEQFKIQSPAKALKTAARELYILFDVRNKLENALIIEDIVLEETGVSWVNVITSLYLAWFGSTVSPYVADLIAEINWGANLCENDFKKVIERYTSTYQEIRTSELGRQYLYTRPFIRTQYSGTISCNCFLNLFLYEHSILWIVRDYFYKKENRLFTSEFGRYFEEYFRELLMEYVPQTNYHKIPEENIPRADWKIVLGKYRFLVEQKSTILGLLAKQQESSINTIRQFAERNIIKALEQLKSTEDGLNDGQYIKIVLLYEDYLKAEALSEIFKMDECQVQDDNHYWLVTIEEMEMLLHTYKYNQQIFWEIIKDKITREIEKSNKGRSLLQLLNEHGISYNQHLLHSKYRKYETLAQNNALQHLANNCF